METGTIVDPAVLGLAASVTATPLEAISLGRLFVARERGERRRSPAKPIDARYDAVVLAISRTEPERCSFGATLRALWSGNAYGEIRNAHVTVDPDITAFHEAALRLEFHVVVSRAAPRAGIDPRAWPMRFAFTGVLVLPDEAAIALDGSYEIDAFGGFRSLACVAKDRPAGGTTRNTRPLVRPGPNIDAPPAPLPADARVRVWPYDAS